MTIVAGDPHSQKLLEITRRQHPLCIIQGTDEQIEEWIAHIVSREPVTLYWYSDITTGHVIVYFTGGAEQQQYALAAVHKYSFGGEMVQIFGDVLSSYVIPIRN